MEDNHKKKIAADISPSLCITHIVGFLKNSKKKKETGNPIPSDKPDEKIPVTN